MLYLASRNSGKLREFQAPALPRGILVEQLPGISQLPPCIEDGKTFEANARKKALHYSSFTEHLVFADDSGICVGALGGAPGVYSARFAGPHATDSANNKKLIEELTKLLNGGRADLRLPSPLGSAFRAHYECVIALAQKKTLLATAQGRVEGGIITTPQGQDGFGYDPYFFYPPLGKTFAEISAEEKFTISHRGVAFRRFLELLGRI
ncbi:MAG: non-canonical purine NTP pyrophosphatase [Terriglobia bacterium]